MKLIRISLVVLTGIIFLSRPADAQFKRLGEKLAKKLVQKELDKADEKADSVKFNYAISLSDNATLFETRDFIQKNNRIISGLIGGADNSDDPEEQAETWINYGENLYAVGKFKSAEFAFQSAKMIFESEGKTTNLDYFRTLANLGLIYHSTGRFNLSEEFTRNVLDKRKEHLGDTSAAYAASLNNLAVLYRDEGKFNEADKMFDQALEINKNSLGEENLGRAIILNNKAMLYQTIGREEEAEELMTRSLEIAKEDIGESTGRYQKLMTNKALLLQDMGKYEEAEELYQEGIRLKERRFGKKHPDYAHMLMHLASLYVEMGKTNEVEELLEESIGIYLDKFGNQSLQYASAVSNLGNFYRYEEKYDKAGELLIRAMDLREDKLGVNNPLYVKSVEDLAVNYWKSGNAGKAAELFATALDKNIEFVRSYFPPMSETEKSMYWDKLYPGFQRFYDFVSENHTEYPDLLRQAFNYRLATKALLLNSTAKIRTTILNSDNRDLIDDYLSWIDHKEMLSRLYAYPKEQIREENINIDSLEEVTNELERSLSERSEIFSSGYSLTEYKFQDILEQINGDEAVIELIHFHDFNKKFTDQARYMALIVKNENKDNPEAVILENGNELDGRYLKYYHNAIMQRVEDEYSYDQYWSDIQNKLAGINKIYLSLDGVYNQININTLQSSNGSYVIDQINIVLVGNAKEVIGIKEFGEQQDLLAQTGKAYIFGFPEYGDDNKLEPLPGTKEEALKIGKILETKQISHEIYLQNEVVENKIKSMDNPKMVHIATHGFFLEDIETLSSEKVFGVRSEKARDNPLLRSGLLLSGSAYAIDDFNFAELNNVDNGVLTAYEAMNLHLDDAEIVVLSACETGRGNIKSGEGVYGLQRAFLVAGSRAVIMSLWKVNDEATQQLMTAFYQNWMNTGNKQDAFKKAQLALKDQYKDPYFWGAFVMVGA